MKIARTALGGLAAFLALATSGMALSIGESREDVIVELGRPQSEMKSGALALLVYGGGTLEFKDGKLQKIPKGFGSAQDVADTKTMYENTQKAKGLVLFRGQWVPKADLDRMKAQGIPSTDYVQSNVPQPLDPTAAAPEKGPGDISYIDRNGEYFRLGELVANGRITVVEFCIRDDGACRSMTKWLEHAAKCDPLITLLEVEVGTTDSALAKSYGIEVVPQVLVYNKKCAQAGPVTADMNTIQSYINGSR